MVLPETTLKRVGRKEMHTDTLLDSLKKKARKVVRRVRLRADPEDQDTVEL